MFSSIWKSISYKLYQFFNKNDINGRSIANIIRMGRRPIVFWPASSVSIITENSVESLYSSMIFFNNTNLSKVFVVSNILFFSSPDDRRSLADANEKFTKYSMLLSFPVCKTGSIRCITKFALSGEFLDQLSIFSLKNSSIWATELWICPKLSW